MLLSARRKRRAWPATDRSDIPGIMKTLIWWALLPLVVLVAVVLWASESREQRIRRHYRNGESQVAIAKRFGISRYQVRKALA